MQTIIQDHRLVSNLTAFKTSSDIRKVVTLLTISLRGQPLQPKSQEVLKQTIQQLSEKDPLVGSVLSKVNILDKYVSPSLGLLLKNFKESKKQVEQDILNPNKELPQTIWANAMTSLRPALGNFSSRYLNPIVSQSCGPIISDIAKLDLAEEALVNGKLTQCKELLTSLNSAYARDFFSKPSNMFNHLLSARMNQETAVEILETYSNNLAFEGLSKIRS